MNSFRSDILLLLDIGDIAISCYISYTYTKIFVDKLFLIIIIFEYFLFEKEQFLEVNNTNNFINGKNCLRISKFYLCIFITI